MRAVPREPAEPRLSTDPKPPSACTSASRILISISEISFACASACSLICTRSVGRKCSGLYHLELKLGCSPLKGVNLLLKVSLVG